MKTAARVAFFGGLIIIFSFWLNRADDTASKILANARRQAEISRQKIGIIRDRLDQLTSEYNADVLDAMATESALLSQIDRMRTVHNASPVEPSGNSEQLELSRIELLRNPDELVQKMQQLPWSPEYPVFLTAVENYIQENISIRSKMAEMIASYEDVIALKDEAYNDLFRSLENMAATKRNRFGFTLGLASGFTFSGSAFVGVGVVWGVRL